MGIKYMPSDGGSWTSIPSGDAKYYDTSSGTWKVLKKGYYMPSDNGTWTEFYTGSDPQTFTLYTNAFASYPTRFARGTSWGNSGNAPWGGDGATTLAVGRYVGASYSLPRYYGIMDFVFTNENSSYLATELAERPVVKSASLRLTRHSTSGTGVSTATGTVYVGEYSGNTSTTYPACSGVSWTDYASKSISLGYGDTVTIDLNNAGHAQDLIDFVGAGGDLSLTNVNSGLCNNGNSYDNSYVWFFGGPGNATSVQPMLTVTLDYS